MAVFNGWPFGPGKEEELRKRKYEEYRADADAFVRDCVKILDRPGELKPLLPDDAETRETVREAVDREAEEMRTRRITINARQWGSSRPYPPPDDRMITISGAATIDNGITWTKEQLKWQGPPTCPCGGKMEVIPMRDAVRCLSCSNEVTGEDVRKWGLEKEIIGDKPVFPDFNREDCVFDVDDYECPVCSSDDLKMMTRGRVGCPDCESYMFPEAVKEYGWICDDPCTPTHPHLLRMTNEAFESLLAFGVVPKGGWEVVGGDDEND